MHINTHMCTPDQAVVVFGYIGECICVCMCVCGVWYVWCVLVCVGVCAQGAAWLKQSHDEAPVY